MALTKEALPEGTPLLLTEYNAGCCLQYEGHDTSEAAAFAFRSVGELDGIVDVLSWWTFTDIFEEGGLPRTEFSDIYGAMTYHGVPKPVWRAFSLLHDHAGDSRLPLNISKDPAAATSLVSAFATRRSNDSSPPAVFLSNWQNGGPSSYLRNRSVTVTLTGGTEAPTRATEYRIDEDHCNLLRIWKQQGEPSSPSAQQLAELQAATQVEGREIPLSGATNDGTGTVTVSLPPNSAVVVVFS